MTVNLPKIAIDILAGQHRAGDIFQDLNAAYWLYRHSPDTALYLLRKAHADLAGLAKAMGYTITPIADDKEVAE